MIEKISPKTTTAIAITSAAAAIIIHGDMYQPK
jgi:hypothetical protein